MYRTVHFSDQCVFDYEVFSQEIHLVLFGMVLASILMTMSSTIFLTLNITQTSGKNCKSITILYSNDHSDVYLQIAVLILCILVLLYLSISHSLSQGRY